MKILRIRSVGPKNNSPAETEFANVADAATFALPAIVLIEDRGGAVLRIHDRAVGAAIAEITGSTR